MNFDDEYDMIFKVVLIGDSGVGKTNILSRYIRDEFTIETKSTVGVELGSKKLKINDTTIKAQIWDTAGQERYKAITNAYFKGSKGALLVFDITQMSSFDSIDRWVGELKNGADAEVSIILVGNKSDLEDQRQVSNELGKKKAEQHNLAYIETSALQAVNIEKCFNMMIEDIYKKCHKNSKNEAEGDKTLSSNVVDLTAKRTSLEVKRKKCC